MARAANKTTPLVLACAQGAAMLPDNATMDLM